MNYDSYVEYLGEDMVYGVDDIKDLSEAYEYSKNNISKTTYSFFTRFDADRYLTETRVV